MFYIETKDGRIAFKNNQVGTVPPNDKSYLKFKTEEKAAEWLKKKGLEGKPGFKIVPEPTQAKPNPAAEPAVQQAPEQSTEPSTPSEGENQNESEKPLAQESQEPATEKVADVAPTSKPKRYVTAANGIDLEEV